MKLLIFRTKNKWYINQWKDINWLYCILKQHSCVLSICLLYFRITLNMRLFWTPWSLLVAPTHMWPWGPKPHNNLFFQPTEFPLFYFVSYLFFNSWQLFCFILFTPTKSFCSKNDKYSSDRQNRSLNDPLAEVYN